MIEETKEKKVWTEPTIDKNWPWVLIQKTTKKDTKEIVSWTAQGLSTSQVSKIKIPYCNGKQLFEFRHGKPIEFELEDVFSIYLLYRQNESRGHINKSLALIAKQYAKPKEIKDNEAQTN